MDYSSMQEEWLEGEATSSQKENQPPQKKVKSKRTASESSMSAETYPYELSYAKFLAQRQMETNVDGEGSEEATEANLEQDVVDVGSRNGDAPDTEIAQPSSNSAYKYRIFSKGVQELCGMTDKELQIISILEGRAIHRRLYILRTELAAMQKRNERIEKMLSEQLGSDGVDKLIWPVTDKDALKAIELSLSQKKAKTEKMLTKQFKRADKSSLYNFIKSNLQGLLGNCGKYTWTGNPPRHVPQAKKSKTATNNQAPPKDDSETVEESEAANKLLSVLLLEDACSEVFPGKTDKELEKEFIHVLNNINAANRKRLQSKTGNKLSVTI